MSSAKGQAWVMDYVVSIIIFLIAITLTVKILTNNFDASDFEDVKRESITVSNHLLSRGSPDLWTETSVLRIGLTKSKNRLHRVKINNYLLLNYANTRTYFGTKYDYGFYFEDKNGEIISMGDQCALGSLEIGEAKTFYNEIRPTAYYYKSESFMSGQMNNFGATFYDGNDDNDVDAFYKNISNYDLLMLENPELDLGGNLDSDEKIKKIEDYIENGGVLFLTENSGLNLTKTLLNTTVQVAGAEVIEDNDEFLDFILTRTIDDSDAFDTSYTVSDDGADSFTILAEYTASNEPFVAKWNYGLGKVYYFSTANAIYKGGPFDVAFQDKIGEGINNAVNVTRANCTSLSNPNADNLVRIERLAVFDSEIVKMVVLAWT